MFDQLRPSVPPSGRQAASDCAAVLLRAAAAVVLALAAINSPCWHVCAGYCALLQDANYSPETTGMLNQQATWQMLELRPQLQQLLTSSGVKVGPINNVGQRTENKNVGVPSKTLSSSAGAAFTGGWRALLSAFAAVVLATLLLAA